MVWGAVMATVVALTLAAAPAAAEATDSIVIDATGTTRPFPHFWERMFGSGRAVLSLRESYRDAGKIKKRTLANLSDWPTELVEGLRTLLKGGTAIAADRDPIIVRRSLPHGAVAAVLGVLRGIGLDRLLGRAGDRCRELVIAMLVNRIVAPTSKAATARMLDVETAASSLGAVLSGTNVLLSL